MMKLACFSLTAAILLAQATQAGSQQPWQQLQNPTAAEVAAHWKAPPPEYGPEPYYGLNGPVSIPQVQRDLDTLHSLGFQAVTVQAGFNMPFAYYVAGVLCLLPQFVNEAKKAQHARVDRGRCRLSQRLCRRKVHLGEARAAHAGA
jgi:hypothetical protein